jgi:CHAD domain-containing protein
VSAEREIKLAAAPTFVMPDLASLGEDLVVSTAPPERATTTYQDTADLRLARAGVSLRFRTGEGWTVKLPGTAKGAMLSRPEIGFPGEEAHLPSDARELVLGYTRTAALTTTARLRTVRSRTFIDDAAGTSLLELDDDEVSVLASGNRIAARFRELEVELTEHTPADLLDAVVFRLRETGAAEHNPISKYARALGPRAAQAPDVIEEPLPPRPTVADLIRHALTASVAHLILWDPVTRLDEDVEGVHQMRVAARRMRSNLRTFATYVDPAWDAALREELAWIGAVLGANRDADVRLERLRSRALALPDPATAVPLLEALDKERDAAHHEVLETLRSDRYLRLLDALVEATRFPPLTVAAEGAASNVTTAVQGQWDSLRTRVKGNEKPPTDAELHRVRIHAKRCRYASEALEPLVGRDARAFAAAAADLQTVLGDHNDAIVMREWLRGRAETDARSVFVAGELAGLELAEAAACRKTWRKTWKRLNSRREPQRWK